MSFILLLTNTLSCTQDTIQKDQAVHLNKRLDVFYPQPAQFVGKGPVGVSFSEGPVLVFIDKKVHHCISSPCWIEIEEKDDQHVIEITKLTQKGFLRYHQYGYRKRAFFTKDVKLKNTINNLRPSAIVAPIKTQTGIYLDALIYPGVAKEKNLKLVVSGDVDFEYDMNSTHIPKISSFPLDLTITVLHKHASEALEQYQITLNKENIIETTP